MSYFYHWRQIDVSYASFAAVQRCEILSEVAFWFFKHLIIIYYFITIQCNVESFNRLSWRKRVVASTPLFIIPGYFLHFSLESIDTSMGYLRFEGNGKIPLGREGKWRRKEWALDRQASLC